MFQRFFGLEQADLKVDLNYPGLPKPRTEKMLMIEVLVSSGTGADRKTRLLTALVEALNRAGTDPNDIMVFFGEIDRASSSFGGGRLAPPVASV
jgi:Tautomerase enzyme